MNKNNQKNKYLFSSESVAEGHPDKLADQISDAILDEILKIDKNARVAAETLCANNTIVLAGEISASEKIKLDFEKIARDVVRDVGYDSDDIGLDGNNCEVVVRYGKQSLDIELGVDGIDKEKIKSKEIGAGDQGLMFGYACDETKEKMPLAIKLSHELMNKQRSVRKNGELDFLRPDAKTQVTVEYEEGIAKRINTVVFSTQHHPEISNEELSYKVIEKIIKPSLGGWWNDDIKILINPTGRFVVGGPKGDSGLTGRKIIVDTYGGYAPHGGGAFSGKDPSKVDRSAAYMARYIAKNIVNLGVCTKCLIQICYAIGVAKPISVYVNTFETGLISDREIEKIINSRLDLRPGAIIERLDLLRPIYRKTSYGGHFGREEDGFPWENLDLREII